MPASSLDVGASRYDPAYADRTVVWWRLAFNCHFWQLLLTLIIFAGQSLLDKLIPPAQVSGAALLQLKAARIRRLLVQLGPTFIKVGQFLSSRRDLLPEPVSCELALLQDQVASISFQLVREILTAELGRCCGHSFILVEEVPLASASIGQVHRALLDDGSPVVFKVQRPGLVPLFYRDLGYLRLLSRIFGRLPASGRTDWLSLADEFGRSLFAEIDYLAEGRNADRLRAVVRSYPQVKIPRVYWRYTSRRVIALEYLPGVKIDKVEELKSQRVNLRSLATLLIECYLEQVVSAGFFHADPHAGNLAVDELGNLIIYDFGMMGEITAGQRLALADCVAAVSDGDACRLASGLVKLGLIRSDELCENVEAAIEPLLDYYGGRDILSLNFAGIESNLEELAAKQAFVLPASLAYLLKTGSGLEGIARSLKPNFSFAAAAQPFIRRRLSAEKFGNFSRVLEQFATNLIVEISTAGVR